MVDKRTARLMHATSFRAALAEQRSVFRQERLCPGLSTSTGAPSVARRSSSTVSAVAAFVRKRPLLPAEEAKGDYDALSVEIPVEGDAACGSRQGGSAPGRVVAHACMMKPDLVRMFVRHTAFVPSGGAMDENAGADDVYGLAAAPLVQHAMRGGHSTLFTYGQTGSGKTFTLEQIFSRATSELAARAGHTARGSAYSLRVSAVEVIGRRCVDLVSRCDCQVNCLLTP
jgi:kinesin family protein 2/24